MKRFARSSTFGGLLLIVLLLTCVTVVFLAVVRPARPAAFMVLRQPWQMPVPLRDRLTRWIPTTPRWAWAWRVEAAVFGQRKPVNLYADVVSLADSSHATLSSLSLGPPNFSDTNGLQVWLLGADQLKALRGHFERTRGTDPLLRARISTADGIESRLFQGESVSLSGSTNQVGLALGCFARVRPDSTDLMAYITLSELVTNDTVALGGPSPLSIISIQTNLDAALRLQVPKGSGIFLFDRSSRDSSRKRIGVIIDPPQPKM